MVAMPTEITAAPADITEPEPDTATGPRLAPHAADIAALMRALGHSGRLQVLAHLRDGGKTVTQLQHLVGAPQPLVSSHLARLRHEGLVRFERVGKCSLYLLADGPLPDLLDHLGATLCTGLAPHLPTTDGLDT